jgi:predicted GIY-YIG superfamily endonuclease
MVAENVQLREEALRSENKIKRKYRKRRTWL